MHGPYGGIRILIHSLCNTRGCEKCQPNLAAHRIKQNGSEYAFPRYTDGIKCNSNSASAALNKWIKQVAGSSNVIHGFRHSFRDRLRAASAPIDMIDQLGGWSLQSVGQGYGDGYDLVSLIQVMSQLQHNLEPDHST